MQSTPRSRASEPQRATQGFVSVLSYVWNRPSLTAIEIAWRWAFGIPAIHYSLQAGQAILDAVPWRFTGIEGLSVNEMLTDPMAASIKLSAFITLVLPGLEHTLLRLGPLLLLWWILLSTLGRTVLLRRLEPGMRPRIPTLLLLQILRLLPILAVAAAWWFGQRAIGAVAIVNPILRGGEPLTMLYVGLTIVLSLSLFVLAAGIGWVFTAAPVLSMRDNLGAFASLAATARLRDLRSSLFEINMVLAIVKIMLLVLAVAFSAFPLPFANVMTEGYIVLWSAIIAVWYVAASDLFHVARLRAYVTLLRPSAGAK